MHLHPLPALIRSSPEHRDRMFRPFASLSMLSFLLCALSVSPCTLLAQTAQAPSTAQTTPSTPETGLTRAVPRPPASPLPPPLPHPVLDRVRSAGSLSCGLAKEEEDYSRAEDHGNRAAFDIDLCKAVAVALFGPGAHLVVKNYPDEPAAIRALLTGEINLLASVSPTVANTARDLTFTQPVLFDGQGFLLPNNPAVHTPLDLAGKKVCFLTGSDAEAGLHHYAAKQGIAYVWYPFSEAGEMEAAFFTGNCDAISSDVTSLANIRAIVGARAATYTILPQLIRQDPLAAATIGDVRFANIVSWTLSALLTAEQLGVTQANAALPAPATQPQTQPLGDETRRFLGQRFGTGTLLGLDPHWTANVIQTVGNYGEIFDRDLGTGSPLRLDRGENRLWDAGGLQFPLPLTDH